MPSGLAQGRALASLVTRNPVFTFIVLAGPVLAISRGTLPLQTAGTGPAMTVKAGFIQGGSVQPANDSKHGPAIVTGNEPWHGQPAAPLPGHT